MARRPTMSDRMLRRRRGHDLLRTRHGQLHASFSHNRLPVCLAEIVMPAASLAHQRPAGEETQRGRIGKVRSKAVDRSMQMQSFFGGINKHSIYTTQREQREGERRPDRSACCLVMCYRFHKNAPSPEGIMPSGCVVVQSCCWSVANPVPGTTISST